MRGADGARLPRRAAGAEAGWRTFAPYSPPWSAAISSSSAVSSRSAPTAGWSSRAISWPRPAGRWTPRGRLLAAFGLDLQHMVKQGSFYLGASRPEVIVANQRLRSSYYTEPAGASTGVPLPFFPLDDVMVAIETIASRS